LGLVSDHNTVPFDGSATPNHSHWQGFRAGCLQSLIIDILFWYMKPRVGPDVVVYLYALKGGIREPVGRGSLQARKQQTTKLPVGIIDIAIFIKGEHDTTSYAWVMKAVVVVDPKLSTKVMVRSVMVNPIVKQNTISRVYIVPFTLPV